MIPNCESCMRLKMEDCGFRGKRVASECVLFHPTRRAVQKAKDEKGRARMKPWLYTPEPPAMFDPHLRGLVNAKTVGGLACPQCGERDHHNSMNGRPWCMSCNVELLPASTLEKWRREPQMKLVK
jgi:hypothetical protein